MDAYTHMKDIIIIIITHDDDVIYLFLQKQTVLQTRTHTGDFVTHPSLPLAKPDCNLVLVDKTYSIQYLQQTIAETHHTMPNPRASRGSTNPHPHPLNMTLQGRVQEDVCEMQAGVDTHAAGAAEDIDVAIDIENTNNIRY